MKTKRRTYLEIIDKVSGYVKAEEQKRICEGLEFNFFSMYDMEMCEEETHQKMMYFILNRIGDKGIRQKFARRLGDILGFPKSYRDIAWEVDREHYITNGRIDLFLYSKEKRICVIMELKIGASDGERQLEKYRDYAESCHYQDYRIVYLTLDGREPSSQSAGSVDEDKIICASFTGHIAEWLEACMEICDEEGIESSLIAQYRLLLVKLGEESDMNENIREIIGSDEERLKACLRIEQALPEIEADILYNFLSEIQKEFRKKRMKIAYSCIDDAMEYYGYRSVNPHFLVEICEVQTSAYSGTVKLCMGIKVEDILYKFIGFYRQDSMQIIPSNEFARKQKRITEKVTDAIQECLNVQVRENNYTSIWWGRIGDMDGDTYDFKHFSDSCIKLVNNELRHKEAERIARICIDECRNLKKRLKNHDLCK